MKNNQSWIPVWVKEWLFGSLRIELNEAERGVWVDFLALASLENGYIRANENTPYPIKQLAGLLCISEELLKTAIDKFIKYDKISVENNGIIKITNWDKYQLSRYQKYRLHSKLTEPSENTQNDTKDTKKQEIMDFFQYYNQKLKEKGYIKRELQLTDSRKKLIEKRLKEFSLEDLKKCVDNFVQDTWTDRWKYIDLQYCIGTIRGINMVEKWLNLKKPIDPRSVI